MEDGRKIIHKGSILDFNDISVEVGEFIGAGSTAVAYQGAILKTDEKNAYDKKAIIKEFYPKLNQEEENTGITRDESTQKLNVSDEIKQSESYREKQELFSKGCDKLFSLSNNRQIMEVIVKPDGNRMYEYGDTLYTISNINNGIPLNKLEYSTLDKKINVIKQMFNTISILNNKGYIMLDFKPENFLWIMEPYKIKILDVDSVIDINKIGREECLAMNEKYCSGNLKMFMQMVKTYPGLFSGKMNVYINVYENIYNMALFMFEIFFDEDADNIRKVLCKDGKDRLKRILKKYTAELYDYDSFCTEVIYIIQRAISENTNSRIDIETMYGKFSAAVNNFLLPKRKFDEAIKDGNTFCKAVFILCNSDDVIKCEDVSGVKYFERIEEIYSNLDERHVNIREQYKNYIQGELINMIDAAERNLEKCLLVIKNLLEYFVPLIKDKYTDIVFDIKFFLLTVYNIKGDNDNANKLEHECDELFENKEMPKEGDFFITRARYLNRKIWSLINIYNYGEALEKCNDLVEECKVVKNLSPGVSYKELAKALGTRVQVKTFGMRNHLAEKEYYDGAVRDSEEAINEFLELKDKIQQYNYRVMLETEAGKYTEALRYLKKSYNLDEDCDIGNIAKNVGSKPYDIMAYFRLMGEASLDGDNKKYADEMYRELNNINLCRELLLNSESEHPYEIIFWKWGTYLAQNECLDEALERYQKAIAICEQDSSYTLGYIGLAIDFEQCSFVIKNNGQIDKYKTDLKNHYNKLMSMDIPECMRKIYDDVDFSKSGWEYFFNMSRRITY